MLPGSVTQIASVSGGGRQKGRPHHTRQTLFRDVDGSHEIKTQKGEVREVVTGQWLARKVGMYTTKAAKASLGGPDALEIGQEDPPGIANEDPLHVSLAVHENTDLTVDLPRDLGHGPRELRGYDGSGRDASLVEFLEPLALQSFEAGCVAGEFVYGLYTSHCHYKPSRPRASTSSERDNPTGDMDSHAGNQKKKPVKT
jgi:hypothetical protein